MSNTPASLVTPPLVHNHGPEEGEGLACRESVIDGRLVGDCLRAARSSGEAAPAEPPWVVWSNEHNAWWRANHRGYCTDLLGAGIYSEEEAHNIAENARSHVAGQRPPEVAMSMADAIAKAAAGVTGDTVVARIRRASPSSGSPASPLSETERVHLAQIAAAYELAAKYNRVRIVENWSNVPTLGISLMVAFCAVAPRYGLRLEGIEEDANEYSDFWQQVAKEMILAASPALPRDDPRDDTKG